MPARPIQFFVILAMVTSSGAAGLGHQMVWIRAMSDVLGANTDVFAKVIGAFFIGLALGAYAASKWSASARWRWLQLAMAELAVLVLALPILLLYPAASVLHATPDIAWLLKLVLPLLLVTPPAFAMGLFLPWLYHALALEKKLTPGRSVCLYGLNIFGGILAIGAVVLFALPTLGLTGTAISVMAVNLLVIALATTLHFTRYKDIPTSSKPKPIPRGGRLPGLSPYICALAFASGFLILAMEVIAQHQVAQISINSLYSSGAVIAVVLLCLAIGPLVLPLLVRIIPSTTSLLAAALALAGLLTLFQPWVFLTANSLEGVPYEDLTALPYARSLLGGSLIGLGPSFFVCGLVFPLLVHRITRHAGEHAGRSIARLLMWNGLGGWLGAEAANLLLCPAFGLWQSTTILGAAYLVFLITLLLSKRHIALSRHKQWAAVTALASILVVAFSFHQTAEFPHVREGTTESPVDYQVGREGVVAVVASDDGHLRMLHNQTYFLGGSSAKPHQERQAHLPLLLHGNARTVGILGIGTGSTAAGAALHPQVERIDAIEISPIVLRFAAKHFSEVNRNVFNDPRFHAIQDDARWVVAQRPVAYDVIIGDLFLPWKTGTGRLYTHEHFSSVRNALNPEGIFCQWLPLYQLTEYQLNIIIATFHDVFPDTFLIAGDFFSQQPILGLVGGMNLENHDWHKTAAAADQLRIENKTKDPTVRHLKGIQLFILGHPTTPHPEIPRNTLRNALIELNAGHNIINTPDQWFTGADYVSFARDIRRHSANDLPALHDRGQFFLEIGHAYHQQDPRIHDMVPNLIPSIPQPLREDPDAIWTLWPSVLQPEQEWMGP